MAHENRSGGTRWALASLSLSMLMPSLDTSIANVGLPTLVRAFGASFRDVQWVVLAYLLAVTTLIVGAGRLGDLLGRRRVLVAGIGLFTAASFLCGAAPTLWLLILARAAQGLGAAMMIALTLSMVGETVPPDRTGSAMGLLGTMSAIGTTLGPSLGGLLIAAAGWRVIFLINVPLGALNLVLALRTLPASWPASRDRVRLDVPGTLLLALSLAAYALAATLGHGRFGLLNAALLAAALAGGGLFLIVEAQSGSPLIRPAMLRDATLGAGLTMSTLVSAAVMATLVVGPFYLSRALGLDAPLVGLAMSVGPLVAAVTGVPAGRLVDRLGAPRMTAIGLLGMAVGLLGLSTAPRALGVVGYLAPIAVVTGGYALFQAANNTAVVQAAGLERRGVISGMLSLSRNLGLVTGASVMGSLFSLASATVDVSTATPGSVAAGMRSTFAVGAAMMLLALAIAMRGRLSDVLPAARAPRAQGGSPTGPGRRPL